MPITSAMQNYLELVKVIKAEKAFDPTDGFIIFSFEYDGNTQQETVYLEDDMEDFCTWHRESADEFLKYTLDSLLDGDDSMVSPDEWAEFLGNRASEFCIAAHRLIAEESSLKSRAF